MRRVVIVIIGGGISGVATAYELALRGYRPLLLEKESLAAMGSGWTLGGVRQSGRDPAELPLAKAAVQQWPTLGEELEADVQYRQRGSLRLARTREEGERIAGVVRTTRAAGIEIEFLPDADAIRRLAPALSCRSSRHPIARLTVTPIPSKRCALTLLRLSGSARRSKPASK